MEYEIHELVQGSPEWLRFRMEHHGASEAAAMLGISTLVSRTELLTVKHNGIAKEFSDFVQKHVLDYGHEVEALARPLVEAIVGEELYPATYSCGKLSASCDGITMLGDITFEHKQWNEALGLAVANKELPEEYQPQCQQVLMVTQAEKLIFAVSDGTDKKFAWMWVYPDAEWQDRIVKGWQQFDKDLLTFTPKQLADKPAAETLLRLPTLAIQIKGEVSLSNLPEFQKAAESFVKGIKTELTTDEDFANAEANVKFLKEAEASLEQAKKQALGQTADIDLLMRTIDKIQEEMKSKRLSLDKLVTSKKEQIKADIVREGRNALAEHVAALEVEIAPVRLRSLGDDFGGSIKNKRTLKSLHDAVDTELARVKIIADTQALKIRANLSHLREMASDYIPALFADLPTLAHLETDHFALTVSQRISEFEKAKLAADEKSKQDATPQAEAPSTTAYPTLTVSGVNIAVNTTGGGKPRAEQIVDLVAQNWSVGTDLARVWILDSAISLGAK